MELDELPESWSVKRLADLCEMRLGKTPARGNHAYWGGNKPWAAISDLNNEVLTETKEGITEAAVRECGCKIVPAGTLLFSFKLTIGKMAFTGKPLFTNEAIAALPIKPGVKLEPKFLFYALKVVPLLEGVSDAAKGMTLNKQSLAEIQIPIPPPAEQRRIVARVEALTRRLDQAHQARQAAIADAAAVGHAVWDRAFADIPPKQWQPIGAHAKVQGGYAFKSEWFVADGIRLLRNQNVYHGDLDWTDTVHLPPSRRGEFKTFELAEGDIVITMDRPLIKSGLKAARVSKQDLPCLLLQRVGRFLCDDELDKDYLLHFLFSQSFIPHISGDGRSCAVPHISAKQIQAIPIPVPSCRKQRAIVARLDALRGKLDELQRLQREVEAELASFTPALLAKAFRGEL